MKRNLIIAAVLIIIIALLAFGHKRSKDPITIGAIYQMTGDARYGEISKLGADLAIEEINEKGGIHGRPLRIVYEDSMTQAPRALSAFQKLTTQDGARVILSQASNVSIAISPLANDAHIIQIDTGSVSPAYRTPNDYTFRTATTALHLVPGQAQFLVDRGITRVGYLYVQDEYGMSMKDTFTKEFNTRGGSIIASEAFAANASDVRSQVTKLISQKPEAIVYVSRLDRGGLIIKQLREQGYEGVLLTDVYGVEAPEVLEAAGAAANGVFYTGPILKEEANKTAASFIKAYKDRYGETPAVLPAQAYDAVMLLAEAMRTCGGDTDSECLRKTIAEANLEGVAGTISFDETGDAIDRTVTIKQIQNGEFVIVE